MIEADFGLTSAELEELDNIIQSFQEIESAMIFGSRAKGTFKSGSDIDIVISGKKVDHSVVIRLSNQLNEETTFPYFFDILDLDTIKSEAMLAHIAQYGRKIGNNS
ncbi:nucleotidyltransferase domain-containing protein [Marinomonas rhizomae]|uniref:Nucleotidyltransferase-like protein n=1 Tax=Marinomonas rhizomae TaxID=491948 RepID=A0A366J8C6_9GAMM|nr:nucleotidyltransferase domain-containing protein [Marinomonas rhizomae]RBP83286.1 nucleotidyltransferase-like protein [Marinomonas rhizomae]RNF68258.1 nucleotidyltransferase domain-containing protein [Marinomonas rhizomae]